METNSKLKKKNSTIKKRIQEFKNEFKIQTTTAILGALAFLIALVWRDFFSEFITFLISHLNLTGGLYLYKLVSAVLISIIAVIMIVIISKINSNKLKKK